MSILTTAKSNSAQCLIASSSKNKTAHGSCYYLLLILSSSKRYFNAKHYKGAEKIIAAAAISCNLSV